MRETTMLRRLLLPLAAAAGAMLSVGCASPPAAEPRAPAVGDAQRVEPSRPVAKSEPAAGDALPPVTLTSALLYRIMAAEVAVQRGELGAAFATFVAVAKETRDPRFAQRAVEVAIGGRAIPQALEAARLWRELAPKSSDAAQTLAALLIADNRFADAAPLLREQIAADAQPAEAIGRVQRMLARAADRAAAFALLQELAAPYRDDPANGAEVRLALAAGAHAAGDAKRAADDKDISRLTHVKVATKFIKIAEGHFASKRQQTSAALEEHVVEQAAGVGGAFAFCVHRPSEGKCFPFALIHLDFTSRHAGGGHIQSENFPIMCGNRKSDRVRTEHGGAAECGHAQGGGISHADTYHVAASGHFRIIPGYPIVIGVADRCECRPHGPGFADYLRHCFFAKTQAHGAFGIHDERHGSFAEYCGMYIGGHDAFFDSVFIPPEATNPMASDSASVGGDQYFR